MPRIRKFGIFGIFAVSSCVILIYYFMGGIKSEYNEKADGYDSCENNISSIGKIVCLKDPPIFFVETAGAATLNVRQACAVESTARHNPSMEVYLLMTTPDAIDSDHELMKKLYSIENVNPLQVNMSYLLHDSPTFKWYNDSKWRNSQFKIIHISDALRVFLMWRYGGAYLDMDIVTLRSFGHLKNAVVIQDKDSAANGIMFFDKGHELMKRCVIDFAENYNPNAFAINGPHLLTRNINKYCGAHKISNVPESSCGIHILPPEVAFPIPYYRWRLYFETGKSVKDTFSVFHGSYMIHVWNQMSKNRTLEIGSNSLYELAMVQNCPLVYNYAQKMGFI